jgi:hypothetical protein
MHSAVSGSLSPRTALDSRCTDRLDEASNCSGRVYLHSVRSLADLTTLARDYFSHGRQPMATAVAVHTRVSSDPYQAYQILRLAFTIAPILAGLDKFFHLLTNWDNYLALTFARLSPIPPRSLMLAIGVVEITAGLIGAFKPRIGAISSLCGLCASSSTCWPFRAITMWRCATSACCSGHWRSGGQAWFLINDFVRRHLYPCNPLLCLGS